MIARFTFQLKEKFSIPASSYSKLGMTSFKYQDFNIICHPPRQAESYVSDIPGTFSPDELRLAFTVKNPAQETNTTLLDDQPVIEANLIIIDFQKESFRRERTQGPEAFDPPPATINEVLKRYILSMRSVTQSSTLKFEPIEDIAWAIQYFGDDGSELEEDPALFRMKIRGKIKMSVSAVTESSWKQVQELTESGSEPFTWETLYLDALSALPDHGAAITLTYASLENLINFALNILGPVNLPPQVWQWIQSPSNDNDWRKEPSVSDMYTNVLKIICDKNLKDEEELWKCFTGIRRARNSYVHEGRLLDEQQKALSAQAVRDLVSGAQKIIEWIETLLPPDKRRRMNTIPVHFEKSLILGPFVGSNDPVEQDPKSV